MFKFHFWILSAQSNVDCIDFRLIHSAWFLKWLRKNALKLIYRSLPLLSSYQELISLKLYASDLTNLSLHILAWWGTKSHISHMYHLLLSALHCVFTKVCTDQFCSVCAWRIVKQDWTLRLLNLLCCSAPGCTGVHSAVCTPGTTSTWYLCKHKEKHCLKDKNI